jgi:hypothetical protein
MKQPGLGRRMVEGLASRRLTRQLRRHAGVVEGAASGERGADVYRRPVESSAKAQTSPLIAGHILPDEVP